MNITFNTLQNSDLPLLLKWLTTLHVREWWDQDVDWTIDLIKEKFGSYVDGYKLEEGISKPMNAYIISVDSKPIGYIQSYNAYDFLRKKPLIGLPKLLAAFDIFIGDPEYLGVGSTVMKNFLENHCQNYDAVFVDPDSPNVRAIRAYEKVGFKKIREEAGEIWMLKN